jgi:hypothetical protein
MLTTTSTGQVALSGESTTTLGELMLVMSGGVQVSGTLSITLGALGIIPEVSWQPVARPSSFGTSSTTTQLPGSQNSTYINVSTTYAELTEA